MATVPTAVETSYASAFREREPLGPNWLRRIRRAAFDRFSELGFPTTHVEEWKYTNLAPVARTAFEPAPETRLSAESLGRAPFASLDAARLVLVNGRFAPELSSPGALPEGVVVSSLAEALLSAPVQEHLARYALFENHALVGLNTAFLTDGFFVHVPNGTVLERPLYLLSVTVPGGRPVVSYPRSLIVIGRGAQARIVEGYLALEEGVYFTNAVTEAVVGENSVVEYTKLEAESGQAYHFGALNAVQERSSSFTSNSLALGGLLVRNEAAAVLIGEGAECTLNGLYVATGRQHVDNHTTMDHAQPHCTSHELYKGVLDGKAEAVFHGRIVVRPNAQKTDAIQRNKNLLLSEDAVINTKPQLEIYADDVRCTHGATVGQVDADAVFYLRSRGIARDEARKLLTYAFAGEMLDRIGAAALRSRVADALMERLSQ